MPRPALWHSGNGAKRFGGPWNPRSPRAVYCSLKPATCLMEAALQRGFELLATRPHGLRCLQIDPLADGQPGVPEIASAASRRSWNLVFSPDVAGARVRLLQQHQQRLVVDTCLSLKV